MSYHFVYNPICRSDQSWSGLVMVENGDCKLDPVQRRTRKVAKRTEIKKTEEVWLI